MWDVSSKGVLKIKLHIIGKMGRSKIVFYLTSAGNFGGSLFLIIALLKMYLILEKLLSFTV